MKLLRKLQFGYYILRYLGPRVVWLRAGVYWNKFTGRSRRIFRPRPWQTLDVAALCQPGTPEEPQAYARFKQQQATPFLFPPGQPEALPESARSGSPERQPSLEQRLALIEQGRCVYFFRHPAPEPIDWHRNPFTGQRTDPRPTWCDIPDYHPEQGDPRMLWEPSRAAWAIDLGRARAHGHDPVRAAETLWQWIEHWMENNPPFRGFQWKCGQESAIRLMSICFGVWALADQPAFTPPRWQKLMALAWATGYRIENHLRYAISQKNNHAISEAAGLILISQMFPELRDAPRWRRIGRQVMRRELLRQIYPDGAYCQQSTNYERVMLQGATFALRLLELAGDPLDQAVYEQLGRCAAFLYQLTDETSGRVAQHGNNDGAWIFPLDECDFWDFRPLVQAVHFLVHRRRLLPPGLWDEDAFWLFGQSFSQADTSPLPRESARFDEGGYYTIRCGGNLAMFNCQSCRDRVGHCDPLKVDLFFSGHNVLRDSGTYQYYIPDRPDMEAYFSSLSAHNALELDGLEPMPRFSRFQRFPFTRARLRHFQGDGPFPRLSGEYYGYDRRPWRTIWRRTIIALAPDCWVFVDDLIGRDAHQMRWFWHFPEAPGSILDPSTVQISVPGLPLFLSATTSTPSSSELTLLCGQDEPGNVQGFASPFYGERIAVPVAEFSCRSALPLRCLTVIAAHSPARANLSDTHDQATNWQVQAETNCYNLALRPPEDDADDILQQARQDSPGPVAPRPASTND